VKGGSKPWTGLHYLISMKEMLMTRVRECERGS